MIKIIIISFLMILAVLFSSLSAWYLKQDQKLQAINNEHLSEIRKVRKMKEINFWLESKVDPFLSSLPQDTVSSEKNIVIFYDKYSNQFSFKISQYLYADELTQNIDIQFSCAKANKKLLTNLMLLKYPTGYIQFKELKTFGKNVQGVLQVVQPVSNKGDDNASH